MKRKTLFLVGFLFLFMIPMLGTATDYAVSEQSITSFSETTIDNIEFDSGSGPVYGGFWPDNES